MKHLMKRAWTKYALVAVVAVMIIAPTAAIAGHNFSDVPSTHLFHSDIEWMLDNGITTGCGSGIYCPDNNVTRGQMAAFMKRLSTTKVVDAKTALTAGNATTADSATTAGNAETLDGLDSTAFAPATHLHTASDVTNGVGVASASNDGGSVTGTLAAVTSVTITAPSAGFVYATADAQMNFFHTTGTVSNATWGLSLSATTFDQNHQDNGYLMNSSLPTGSMIVPGAVTGVFPVSAGSNTIYFLASASSGSVSFNDATLTVLFVPTSVGPVTTASTASEGSDPADG